MRPAPLIASIGSAPKVRFALVGCGAVGASHHLPALAACQRAEAVLLVDRDAGRAQALARRWGVPAAAADFHEVVGKAEAAVLALPNHLHAPVAIELLRSGVHVLAEKPMALDTSQCDAMIAAAEEGGARLTVGLQFRFFDSTRLVKELLAAEILGPLDRFDLRLGVISNWPFATGFALSRETAGGGVLVDYGVHLLDLLLFWLGDWAEVRYRDDARGGIESDCELELAMGSGVAGRVEVSRTRNLRNTCRFTGRRATLELGIWDPDPPITLSTGGSQQVLSGRALSGKKAGLDFIGAFRRQLEDLAGAIREGREPAISGREGRRSVALIEACYGVREPLERPWMHPPQLAEVWR